MARNRRTLEEEAELNLAPIMNMVVILIPMLLLSIVFLKVGVINITAPKLSIGPPSETPPPDEEPLNLTVTIGAKGFFVAGSGATLPPEPGCPTPGPTICLDNQSLDITQKLQSAREEFGKKKVAAGEKFLDEAITAYDWKRLYGKLVEIKNQHPDETIIKISGDPDTPYSLIVRLMDVTRYKLEKASYKETSEFWTAPYEKKGEKLAELFPDPVLAVVQ
jgi:biopolymer transport protein ExbD